MFLEVMKKYRNDGVGRRGTGEELFRRTRKVKEDGIDRFGRHIRGSSARNVTQVCMGQM